MIRILTEEDPSLAEAIGDELFIGLLFKGDCVYPLFKRPIVCDDEFKWNRSDYWKEFPREHDYIKKYYPEALL